MLERDLQIEKVEEEIDELLDSELDPARLSELIDELEELLVNRENHYTLRLVK